MVSETSKWRDLTVRYCLGNGVDLGAGGDPVVPTALQIDLPASEAEAYTTTDWGRYPIQFRGDARHLCWFADGSLDYVYASHLLEDFADWAEVVREWQRVVRPGGYLVILVPDSALWAGAVDAGQPCNQNHAREFAVGELTRCVADTPGWEVCEDRLADPERLTEHGTPEFTILFVARRVA